MHQQHRTQIIGNGNFSTVYKVQNIQTKQLYAMKFMTTHQQIAQKQAKLLQQFNHPNIIKFFSYSEDKQGYKILMEYLPVNALTLYEQKEIGLKQSVIKWILFQISLGLAYIHKKGIIHRDIKPQNILIDEEKKIIKIIDFGLAISDVIANTDYIATRWYRAPENLLSTNQYTTAIDIFALGCVIVQMYLGNPLFPGDDNIDQIYRIVNMLGYPTPQWEKGYQKIKKLGIEFEQQTKIDHMSLNDVISASSQQLRQLIGKMIELNPKKRITAEQIIKHSYFKDIEKIIPEQIYKFYKDQYQCSVNLVSRLEKPSLNVINFGNPVYKHKYKKSFKEINQENSTNLSQNFAKNHLENSYKLKQTVIEKVNDKINKIKSLEHFSSNHKHSYQQEYKTKGKFKPYEFNAKNKQRNSPVCLDFTKDHEQQQKKQSLQTIIQRISDPKLIQEQIQIRKQRNNKKMEVSNAIHQQIFKNNNHQRFQKLQNLKNFKYKHNNKEPTNIIKSKNTENLITTNRINPLTYNSKFINIPATAFTKTDSNMMIKCLSPPSFHNKDIQTQRGNQQHHQFLKCTTPAQTIRNNIMHGYHSNNNAFLMNSPKIKYVNQYEIKSRHDKNFRNTLDIDNFRRMKNYSLNKNSINLITQSKMQNIPITIKSPEKLVIRNEQNNFIKSVKQEESTKHYDTKNVLINNKQFYSPRYDTNMKNELDIKASMQITDKYHRLSEKSSQKTYLKKNLSPKAHNHDIIIY